MACDRPHSVCQVVLQPGHVTAVHGTAGPRLHVHHAHEAPAHAAQRRYAVNASVNASVNQQSVGETQYGRSSAHSIGCQHPLAHGSMRHRVAHSLIDQLPPTLRLQVALRYQPTGLKRSRPAAKTDALAVRRAVVF